MAFQPSTPRNRTPLAELPTVPGMTMEAASPEQGAATRRRALTPRVIDSPSANIPDSIMTPTLSPEEDVIRQRGRRRTTIMWSPDHNRSVFLSPMKTPTKNISSMTLRSSPRKRSLMQELSDVALPSTSGVSPHSKRLLGARMSVTDSPGSSTKRMKVEESAMNRQNDAIPLETILKGYSREQLIAVIGSLVARDEQLEATVRNELPIPDIAPLEGELIKQKKNIFASVPNQKFLCRTDGHGYLRAATHLATFKQTVYGQSQNLYTSRHWDALLDYVMMAWTHVRETPVYENAKHNAVRRYCFKLLSHHASNALKHGSTALGRDRVVRLQHKLTAMVSDWAEVNECSKCIEYIMKSF
ncbi:uncharacterized protein LOC131292652 [Anopheles ziemanni]|nr:uncharacterized protein LOC131292652 [Anopheles ziemanni]